MGLETAAWISELVDGNPGGGDNKSQGDDHLRMLKEVLQANFPNASKAFYFPETEAKTTDFTVDATDMHKTFLVDTTAGAMAATLPALVADDAGWECYFLKTNTGTHPYFITPPSGTIQSGDLASLAKTRRCIPGVRCSALWTGGAWVASRAISLPVASIIETNRAAAPVGYVFEEGTALASADLFPDYNAAMGGLTVTDRRGRLAFGLTNMGGSESGRISAAAFGAAISLLAAGGADDTALEGQNLFGNSFNADNNNDGSVQSAPRWDTSTPVDLSRIPPSLMKHFLVVVE